MSGPLPGFAVTLGEQAEKYGAYVGIVAFFGLAILIVLFFAQARELKRLRDWAGRSPERMPELEAQVAALAAESRAVRAEPQAPVAAPAPAAPVLASPAARPQTASAQRRPGTVVHPAAAAIPAATAAATATAAAAMRAPERVAAVAAPSATPPGRNGTSASPPVPAPATVAGNGSPPAPTTPAPATPAPPAPPRPATGDRPAPTLAPRRPAPAPAGARRAGPAARRSGRSGVLTALLALGAVAAVAGLVFLGLQVFGGDDAATPPPANTVADQNAAPNANTPRRSVTETRAETTVAVLNGTTSPGLAASVADRLNGAGYAEDGNVDTYSDQTLATSTVYYKKGQQRQAQDAAKVLGISDTEPLSANDQALAGDKAELLVVVGADKAPG